MGNTPALQPCDVLAFGPHPDDIEIAAAGTLLLSLAGKRSVSLVDLTRGEKGSRGTVLDRDAEAAAAAKKLGVVERVNLRLPDAGILVDEHNTNLLVAVLRSARPALLLAPHARDVHPDHTATALLAERAFFLAGLRNHEPQLGAPHRPRLFLRYPGNQPIEPSLVVDISAVASAKADVVRCYRSQSSPPDRAHLVQGLDLLERAEVRDRFHGARIGVRAAEAFWHDGPVPVRDLQLLLG
ncbi:MAG TPA: bacillithiol biosynthesis deacetylase BshB1 [Planctomycetota bacterium]|nr:bacillithiol biosynthesis deacetylase BshB1 [Planctomycetota bacterium]